MNRFSSKLRLPTPRQPSTVCRRLTLVRFRKRRTRMDRDLPEIMIRNYRRCIQKVNTKSSDPTGTEINSLTRNDEEGRNNRDEIRLRKQAANFGYQLMPLPELNA
jgi:hypothetical protein